MLLWKLTTESSDLARELRSKSSSSSGCWMKLPLSSAATALFIWGKAEVKPEAPMVPGVDSCGLSPLFSDMVAEG